MPESIRDWADTPRVVRDNCAHRHCSVGCVVFKHRAQLQSMIYDIDLLAGKF